MVKKIMRISLFLLLAFAALPVFASGQNEEAKVSEVKEVKEDVVLHWRTRPDNQEEIAVYQAISDQLSEELDGITLVYEAGGSETSSYQDVLKTELVSGTAPDLFWIPGTDVADFVTRDLLLDVRAIADKTDHNDNDFYPGPMYHLTYNPTTNTNGDVLWGIPRDVSTFALYMNLDLIAESGADDPRELAKNGDWDWDAFYDVIEKVSTLGDDVYGYGQSGWWGPSGVWSAAAGGGFYNEDRTASNMHTKESLAGLEFQTKFYQAGLATPWGQDPEPPFRAGKLGLFQNGRWATPGMRSGVDFDWDVVELPKGPSGSAGNWLFWGAYVVNKDTANGEAAFKLLQRLTSAEVQGQIAKLGANIPSRKSQDALDAFLQFTPPENAQAFLNGLADNPVAEGPLWSGSWPEFDAVLGAKMASVLLGELPIEEFASSIQSELDKTFK